MTALRPSIVAWTLSVAAWALATALPGASALPVGEVVGTPPDPFAAGIRWSAAAQPSRPWIPSEVAFCAVDELVWTAARSSTAARFQLFAAGALDEAVLRRARLVDDPGPGPLRVAEAGSTLVAVHQPPSAGPALRRTLVQGHRPRLTPDDFEPLWTHDAGVDTGGPAFLRADADTVVLAVQRLGAGTIQVDWLEPETGVLVARAEIGGTSLRALSTSIAAAPNGLPTSGAGATTSRAALSIGAEVIVLERVGEQVGVSLSIPLETPPMAVALSADGRRLVCGRGSALESWTDFGAGFELSGTWGGSTGELALDAELSADGATVVVGWWNAVLANSARLELLDLNAPAGPSVLASWEQANPVATLQEYPADVDLTADGRRAAGAFWGGGGDEPEVVLLDRDGSTVLAVDLPGSAFDIALDAAGTRIAVAAKNVHANLVSDSGAIYVLDTGERDLQIVGAPDLGTNFQLVTRRPAWTAAFFLVGAPAVPNLWPGLSGHLGVDLGQRWVALIGAPLAEPNTAAATVLAPLLPGLVGAQLACQAVTLASPGGAALSECVVRPALF